MKIISYQNHDEEGQVFKIQSQDNIFEIWHDRGVFVGVGERCFELLTIEHTNAIDLIKKALEVLL